jgi:hypothetical protein
VTRPSHIASRRWYSPSVRARFLLVLMFAGCRCNQQSESTPVETKAPDEPEIETGPFDASHAMTRDAQPGVEAGAIDPACTGDDLDLAAVVVDPRCAIRSAQAKHLLVDGGTALTQDAKREADGRVLVRLINAGKTSLTLPISWHPKLPAFSALAEDEEHHALYELQMPELDVAGAADAGSHIARIVMPSGGIAHARVVVSTNITKRIAPSCDDGGTCAPARLPPGKYTLHIGQLVCDVPGGPPARIPWTVAP